MDKNSNIIIDKGYMIVYKSHIGYLINKKDNNLFYI